MSPTYFNPTTEEFSFTESLVTILLDAPALNLDELLTDMREMELPENWYFQQFAFTLCRAKALAA